MKSKKLLALALAAILVLCLMPASAFADGEDEPRKITNEKDETVFNSGDIVFNNEGIVYNNSGVVYNNGGTVYNNGGTAYNNAGVVYNNGGTVYNNDGTVYNNDGIVHSNGGTVEEGDGADAMASDGELTVAFAADYSAFAEYEGLTATEGGEGYLMGDGGACTISPKEGCSIAEASTDAGELTENEDGSYTLSALDKSAVVTLSIKLAAPAVSVDGGTFGSGFELELSAVEGAEIYYTTDGSEPAEDSERYQGPITVDKSMTIQAVAVAENAGQSDITEVAYVLPELTTPLFDTESEGYKQPAAKGLVVDNSASDADAVIVGMALSGETPEAFILSTTEGAAVPAGEKDDSTWTVRPEKNLEKGSYSARLTVNFDSGDSTVLFLSFKVK